MPTLVGTPLHPSPDFSPATSREGVAGTGETKIAYRPDIDGLRAVAVLLVVLFHTGLERFSGGFVGVDVFFVISGYLISGIIAREMSLGCFSVKVFYVRRLRRIFPALITVLLACSLVAYFVLLPEDLIRYAQSLLAALFSYSNVYFWTQSGYFSPTHVKLLLHTWSLGVEEQFYVVFPLILLAVRRKPSWTKPALLGITLVSFMAAEGLLLVGRGDESFYMLYSRAWELLLGSLLALDFFPVFQRRWPREMLAFLGAVLLVIAAFGLSPKTPFPGAAALLPCVGTALLIATGKNRGTICSSLLSGKPLVFIGKISYSVYLWHWPLILFAKMGFIPGVNDKGFYKLVVLAVSLVLGWLSWYFVERPFRTGRWKNISSGQVFGWAAAAACVVVVVAASFVAGRGLPGRMPPAAAHMGVYLDAKEQMEMGTCFITSNGFNRFFKPNLCTQPDPTRRNYLLIGDSHAAALWFGLHQELKNTQVMMATVSGCDPKLGDYDSSSCGQLRQYLYQRLLPHMHPDAVIVTEAWRGRGDVDDLEPAIHRIQQLGIPVILVGPVPEYDVVLPMILAFSIERHDPALPKRHLLYAGAQLDQYTRAKAAEWHVQYLSVWGAICPAGVCAPYADSDHEVPMLIDTNHLSNAGSQRVARAWVQQGQFN